MSCERDGSGILFSTRDFSRVLKRYNGQPDPITCAEMGAGDGVSPKINRTFE